MDAPGRERPLSPLRPSSPPPSPEKESPSLPLSPQSSHATSTAEQLTSHDALSLHRTAEQPTPHSALPQQRTTALTTDQEFRDLLDQGDKLAQAVYLVCYKNRSIASVSSKHQGPELQYASVQRGVERHKAGYPIRRPAGRPSTISQLSLGGLRTTAKQRFHHLDALTRKELEGEIDILRLERLHGAGETNLTLKDLKPMDRKTYKVVITKGLELTECAKPTMKNKRRVISSADVLNTVSLGSVVMAALEIDEREDAPVIVPSTVHNIDSISLLLEFETHTPSPALVPAEGAQILAAKGLSISICPQRHRDEDSEENATKRRTVVAHFVTSADGSLLAVIHEIGDYMFERFRLFELPSSKTIPYRSFLLLRPAVEYDRFKTSKMLLKHCVLNEISENRRYYLAQMKDGKASKPWEFPLSEEESRHVPIYRGRKKQSSSPSNNASPPLAARHPIPFPSSVAICDDADVEEEEKEQEKQEEEEEEEEEEKEEKEGGVAAAPEGDEIASLELFDDFLRDDDAATNDFLNEDSFVDPSFLAEWDPSIEKFLDSDEFMNMNILDSPSADEKNALDDLLSVLFFDGEYFQLNAVVSLLQEKEELCKGVRFVKLPAGTSLLYQPNDKSPAFRILKNLLRTLAFKKNKIGQHHRPQYLKSLEEILKKSNMEASSRTTFLQYFRQIPEIIHRAFSPDHVANGWEKTGIYPFCMDTMLHQCTSFGDLSKEKQEDIKNAIPKLAIVAREKGKIEDKDMVEAIKFAYTGHGEDTRDYTTCPLHYDRAVSVDHPATLEREEERKRARTESLPTSLPSSNNADTNQSAVADSGKKQKRATRYCANNSCQLPMPPGDKSWLKCPHKGCNLYFCPNCVTASHRTNHCLVCRKRPATK